VDMNEEQTEQNWGSQQQTAEAAQRDKYFHSLSLSHSHQGHSTALEAIHLFHIVRTYVPQWRIFAPSSCQ
jgi:hypothetical protein